VAFFIFIGILLMMPANLDLTIYRGDSFILPLVFSDVNGDPINITNYVFKGQVKKSSRDVVPLTEFTFLITNGPLGNVTMSLTHAQTETLNAGVYDVQATVGDVVQTYMYGKVKMLGEVTLS
jgi:hypothetical protein